MGEESVKEDSLKRTIMGKSAAKEFIGLLVSNTATISFTLEAIGDDGDIALVIGTLQNDNNLRLFGTPHMSFDDDGANGDYWWKSWIDLDASDGNNLKFKFWILNQDNVTRTINYR